MLEKLILPDKMNSVLIDATNRDDELGGYFLGERTKKGILILEGQLAEDSENAAGVNYVPRAYWEKVQGEPTRYVLLSSHIHSRSFGKRIERYDPYWSVSAKSSGQTPNEIVDRFYISAKETADNDVIEVSKRKIGIDYVLFVHPEWESEGQTMSRDKAKVTGYKYDPTSIGKVAEIPVSIQ